jgi:NTE family protein
MRQLFLLLFALLLTILAPAQKVGLVLSGGGAKGLAHIGLIKVLEDHGIPIDYVAGTSIGAIIGGLYAAGYSPEEMLELFNSDEFKLWSTGRLDKESLYYFKRKDEFPDWIKLDLTRRNEKVKLILPLNLVPERQMDFAFLELLAQTTAACRNNFDSLMIPFRCVSTDIYNNRAIIHRDGDLGEAIRASMTFPLVYKPIEIDGVLLYDGGIVNNFPAKIVQEDFKPDYIIGHIVAEINRKPDPDDLFKQIETMVMQRTEYDVPDSLGIVMETKLSNVGLVEFQKVNYTYSRGIETALLLIDSIEKAIDRRIAQSELNKRRDAFNDRKPNLIFGNVQVEGIDDNAQRKYIIQSIKDKRRTVTLDQLRESYFKLIADDHIKSIRPVAFYNTLTGYYDLTMKVELRKPFDVEFGGHLSTRANTFGFVELNYKTFKTLSYTLSSNLYFGKFYNSLMIGGRMDAPSNRPFYLSGYFTYNMLDYLATSTDLIFTDIKPSYITRSESNTRFEIGIPYTKTGVLNIGISQSNADDQYYQTKVFNVGDKLDKTNFKAFSGMARVNIKNFDFKQYPTQGGQKMFSIRYIRGTEKYTPGTTAPNPVAAEHAHNYLQMKAYFDQYYPIGRYFTLGALAEGSVSNNKLFNNYTAALMHAPAFTPTPNSQSLYLENFRANQYFAVGTKLIYRITDLTHLRAEAYGFFPLKEMASGENGKAIYTDNLFPSLHYMGLMAWVYQTPIGPLSFEFNLFDKPGQKWFFSVNLGYMLFNKRGYGD